MYAYIRIYIYRLYLYTRNITVHTTFQNIHRMYASLLAWTSVLLILFSYFRKGILLREIEGRINLTRSDLKREKLLKNYFIYWFDHRQINVADAQFEMQSNRDQTHPTVCVYYARYIAAHYRYWSIRTVFSYSLPPSSSHRKNISFSRYNFSLSLSLFPLFFLDRDK